MLMKVLGGVDDWNELLSSEYDWSNERAKEWEARRLVANDDHSFFAKHPLYHNKISIQGFKR